MINRKFLIVAAFSTLLMHTNCSESNEMELDSELDSTTNATTASDTTFESEVQAKSLELENFSSFSIDTNGSPMSISKLIRDFVRPLSTYGTNAFIDFTVNDDNTIDVIWLESSCTRHISRIALDTKTLVKDIPIPDKANRGGFLGFESLGDDKFVVGYTKDNSFGDKEAEAWYTAFDSSGTELFSTRIWGDRNLDQVDSKATSRQFGSSVIRYNKADNTIAVYLAHTMKWDDGIRHQGGWLGFLDGTSGEIKKRSNGEAVGSGWFFSHNFDQRGLISSKNTFYALAHGDAFPRALGISSWSAANGNESDLNYYDITNGFTGDNTTLATTGDFTELSNGNVAIVYSTEDTRTKRDLRISIVEGMLTNNPSVQKETWLTSLNDAHVGWGSKVAQYDDEHIIVGWNTFDDANDATGSHFMLTDMEGTATSETFSLPETVLYPSQSFKKSADGKHMIFVAEENGKINVHLIAI